VGQHSGLRWLARWRQEPTLDFALDERVFAKIWTADLAPCAKLDVRDILKTAGISGLLVYPRPEEAFASGDQVAVLQKGRIQPMGRAV